MKNFLIPEMDVSIASNVALASGSRTFQGFHDHEPLPAVARMNHKIAFRLRRQQDRLLVCYGRRIYMR
jgi:hypothetical protein